MAKPWALSVLVPNTAKVVAHRARRVSGTLALGLSLLIVTCSGACSGGRAREHQRGADLADSEPQEPGEPGDLGLDLRRRDLGGLDDLVGGPDLYDKDASATPFCKDNGGACASSVECCGLLVCDEDICKTPVTCKASAQPCGVTKECCAGLACVEGECLMVAPIDVLSRPCSAALPCVADGIDCFQLASASTGVCSKMCSVDGDCPDGGTCVANFCLKECGAAECATGSTCFSEYACWPDCRLQPGFCGSDQACDDRGLCCQATGAECDDTLPCCDGLSCVGGACQNGTGCRQTGAACGHTNQCCSGLVCNLGECQPPPACKPIGSDCTAGWECCGETACYSGKCSTFCGGGSGTAGTYCLDDDDCCNGYACLDAGTVTKCMVGERLCHPDSDVCLRDSECCSGFCNPQLYCSPACGLLLDSCSNSNPCCEDYVCTNGKCEMPACAGLGQTCGNGKYCCGTAVCQNGSCKTAGPSCTNAGGTCASSNACCSGLDCAAGHCQAPLSCGADGTTCATDGACCEGLQCIAGACAPPTGCAPSGTACAGNGDCCAGLACTGGHCQGGASCGASGSSCSDSQPCCAGLSCHPSLGCAKVTSCSTGVFQYTSFLGSDPTLWARCDGGKGPQVCKSGAWVTLADDRCFCVYDCSGVGTSCTSDGSGVCARLDSDLPSVCVNRSWGLCVD